MRPSRNEAKAKELRDLESGEVPVLVPSTSDGHSGPDFPPDLARVAAAWEHLPDAIKSAIGTLIDAASVNPKRSGKGGDE